MKSSPPGDVTAVLQTWNSGDREALNELLPLVYGKLRRIAKLHLYKERRPDHTLQPAALVHEVYLRFVDKCRVSWQNRAHFFAIAATTMRRILVEHARSRRAAKRDTGQPTLPLIEAAGIAVGRPPHLTALDDCLTALARTNPLQAAIVKLRFFDGLSVDETAEALGCSRATIIRRWRVARIWLRRELSGATNSHEPPPR